MLRELRLSPDDALGVIYWHIRASPFPRHGCTSVRPWDLNHVQCGLLIDRGSLWDTIRRHEAVIPIAQLAEDHYRRHGKPLRIAVDEADWRFNNLTPQQVFMIRESE